MLHKANEFDIKVLKSGNISIRNNTEYVHIIGKYHSDGVCFINVYPVTVIDGKRCVIRKSIGTSTIKLLSLELFIDYLTKVINDLSITTTDAETIRVECSKLNFNAELMSSECKTDSTDTWVLDNGPMDSCIIHKNFISNDNVSVSIIEKSSVRYLTLVGIYEE